MWCVNPWLQICYLGELRIHTKKWVSYFFLTGLSYVAIDLFSLALSLGFNAVASGTGPLYTWVCQGTQSVLFESRRIVLVSQVYDWLVTQLNRKKS